MTEPTGPLARYRSLVAEGALRPDPAQRAAVEKLQLLHGRLKGYRPPDRGGKRRLLLGLFGVDRRGADAETGDGVGLYLYGGVGRGKSMLMDLFFENAPVEPKRRVHFHAFMQEVHHAIAEARKTGTDDPIKPVAKDIADSATLLCFDELQVTNIADAMILGRLFQQLFERGVVVVATSNRHPTDLYKNGLNRELFLPFIEMLCERLDVHQLDGPTDFRLARLRGLETYYAPLGPEADAAMDEAWAEVTGGRPEKPLVLEVGTRSVTAGRRAGDVGRASFEELCAQPLGPADFLALTEAVGTLFLDRIPKLSRARNNEASRFVTLVDALYEAKAQLVCSAAAEPDDLYTEGEGAFEFERTASRLWEMRSEDWVGRD